MIAGPVKLGAGSVLLINRDKWGHLDQTANFRKTLDERGVKTVFYLGGGHDSEEPLSIKRAVAHKVIQELGGWRVMHTIGFWTPTSPAFIQQQNITSTTFFQAFFDHEHSISFGSEYYSVKGSASLFSSTERLNEAVNSSFFPNFLRDVRSSLNLHLQGYLESFKRLDNKAKSHALEFLSRSPRTSDSAEVALIVPTSLEPKLYTSPEFIAQFSTLFRSFKGGQLEAIMMQWPAFKRIPESVRKELLWNTLTIKYLETLSPVLSPTIDNFSYPEGWTLSLENKSLTWKLETYAHVHQRYIDAKVDVEAVMDFFERAQRIFDETRG